MVIIYIIEIIKNKDFEINDLLKYVLRIWKNEKRETNKIF